MHIGAGAIVGARSTLMPGATDRRRGQVAPGSAVLGKVKAGQLVAGSPAERRGKARHSWPDPPARAPADRPAVVRRLRRGVRRAGAHPVRRRRRRGRSWSARCIRGTRLAARGRCPCSRCRPAGALAWFLTNLLLVLVTTRLLGLGLAEGYYRVRSRIGWQVWATERVLDMARDLLFPIYASLFTPVWLRLLGAKVGRNVEASTVLLLPRMTTVGEVPSWPTTRWSPPTNSAAAGCGLPRPRSASGPSWATRA